MINFYYQQKSLKRLKDKWHLETTNILFQRPGGRQFNVTLKRYLTFGFSKFWFLDLQCVKP